MINILIVDDSNIDLQIYKEMLVNLGYNVTATNAPDKALKMVVDNQPDLIIMDIHMPLISGVDLAKLMKEVTDTPIVFLTGSEDINDVRACIRVGCLDFLRKGSAREEIQSTIGTHVLSRITSTALSPLVDELNRIKLEYSHA